MAVAVSYPGVYVQEVPSGVRTIAGVSTSTTMFVGSAARGPMATPVRLASFSDFERAFGDDSSVGDMARYVKLFYLNGGSDAYVMRIADGATAASVRLQSEAGTEVLELIARQPGALGNRIRATVSYAAREPEVGFNMEIWRAESGPGGQVRRVDVEEFRNLSMNPLSPLYAPDILSQRSRLVRAEALVLGDVPGGFSQAGRPVPYTAGSPSTLRDNWETVLTARTAFRISVGGSRFVSVDLAGITEPSIPAPGVDAVLTELGTRIAMRIQERFAEEGLPGVQVTVTFPEGPAPIAADGDASRWLRIAAVADNADVLIRSEAGPSDLAVPLMLGSEQGGLERGAHAARRPAPSGLSLRTGDPDDLTALAGAAQGSIAPIRLPERQPDGTFAPVEIPVDLVMSAAAHPLYLQNGESFPDDLAGGLAVAIGRMRDAINTYRESHPDTFPWRAERQGMRLAVLPTGPDDLATGVLDSAGATDIAPRVTQNVARYVLGPTGIAGLQTPGVSGDDGDPPTLSDYEAAFRVIDSEVDYFAIMVLPPSADSAVEMPDLYRTASVFCRDRRAFLVMDAPTTWDSAQAASTGVAALRIGLVRDHAALYFPRLSVVENGRRVFVGPAGAMAGLMARIDGSRGVWKAPAGIEADIRGINGVEYRFSDPENGFMNPRAVNTIRQFPAGVVSWGARTMDGDDDLASEWKYVPIRRLALFMEESLYRGLKWAVFEPNDEPLWSQIRLNVGAFMHGLFRQGAFQGQTKSEAYFVKCDAETTTQADRNLGIVNIWVGFAPLKPAEFVVLYLQQIAGQIES